MTDARHDPPPPDVSAPEPPRPDDPRIDAALFGPDGDARGGPQDDPPGEYDLLAASLLPAVGGDPVPPAVMDRLRRDARAHVAPPEKTVAADPRRPLVRPALLGLLVGVATFALLVSLLLPPGRAGRERPQFADLNPEAARERVLNAGDELLRVPLEGTEDAAAVAVGPAGAALWDGDAQHGVLELTGLKPNDPSSAQYQLWIFDADRDERYPVDGGVFDVPAGTKPGETVLIPFEPRVPVAQPTLFAVTVERPGGVVVSDRSRLPVAGAVTL